MAVKESKLKTGVLTIGGTSFETQATNVRLTPPDQPSGDDAGEVLAGDKLTADGGKDSTWVLNITAIQDFNDTAGFVMYCFLNKNLDKPFTWKPNAKTTGITGSGHTWSGTITVWPVEIGGDVNKRLTTSAEFNLVGDPVRTEAT